MATVCRKAGRAGAPFLCTRPEADSMIAAPAFFDFSGELRFFSLRPTGGPVEWLNTGIPVAEVPMTRLISTDREYKH